METTLLAVNGTLMRGLELNPNLLAVGATFVREDETDACYRIWSIGDRHPAMHAHAGRGHARGARAVGRSARGPRVDPAERAAGAGDRQGGAEDGSIVLGVLGEPFLCEGQREITAFGGWRAYIAAQQTRRHVN